jgi:2-keto-4-pentenoate hydratase/2-oxohepta-3-ene-1,7-dioic acid hydratase in catechol pathway
LCIGLNYLAHAAEGSHRQEDLPSYPKVFGRWTQSLTTGGTPVPVPSGENGLDWEGEIAAYVGRPLADASAEASRAAVLGFSTFNDLTPRTAQKRTSQWTLGKNVDHSSPLGPIVPSIEGEALNPATWLNPLRESGQRVSALLRIASEGFDPA